MKAGIHPVYVNAKVLCACGNAFETRATKELIKVEICSACHPFFTGQQKLVDTAGRVERFNRRFKATEGKTVVKKKAAKTAARKAGPVGVATRRKVLSTAPTKESDKAGGKKKEKTAKPAAKKAA
ncbi:MAG: 50S ribosomal protein L31 [Elusimicrobiota bacterium]